MKRRKATAAANTPPPVWASRSTASNAVSIEAEFARRPRSQHGSAPPFCAAAPRAPLRSQEPATGVMPVGQPGRRPADPLRPCRILHLTDPGREPHTRLRPAAPQTGTTTLRLVISKNAHSERRLHLVALWA